MDSGSPFYNPPVGWAFNSCIGNPFGGPGGSWLNNYGKLTYEQTLLMPKGTGYTITPVVAFGKTILIGSFGALGDMTEHENGAITFANKTASINLFVGSFVAKAANGGAKDIYTLSNLVLNAVNLFAFTAQTRQLPDLAKLDAMGSGFLRGVNKADVIATRVGVGTSIMSGAISIAIYSTINNPKWGDKAQLGVGITSSVLSAVPYTTYLGVGMGLADVAGFLNIWYDAWNNAETMYKTTGVTILPLLLPSGMPVIIGN